MPRKVLLAVLLALSIYPAMADPAEVTVTVDLSKPGATIDRHIYGQFAEHLYTGIYGGIWVGENSKIANINGYRKDVVAALKHLNVPVVRWPGGCSAQYYNGRDGIGPRAKRPKRNDTRGGIDSNAFGTHEYMNFVELIAAMVVFGAAWKANSFETAYETKVGESRGVTLPDGSSMALNTDTKAVVDYTLFPRDLTLERGEALFNVVKKKARPFVVRAGDAHVRAIGTSFAVSELVEHPLKVTVREGVVEVSTSGTSAARVRAGMRATGRTSGGFDIEPLDAGELARELAWLDGRLFFRHQTLAAAAREFERYSTKRIVIDDPAVANKTVTGIYVATDPVGFAKAVAVLMDMDVVPGRATPHLRHKKI